MQNQTSFRAGGGDTSLASSAKLYLGRKPGDVAVAPLEGQLACFHLYLLNVGMRDPKDAAAHLGGFVTRSPRAFALSLWVSVALVTPGGAQSACSPDALGVSRVIEVDATGGPRFGEPSGDPDFLAPGEVVLTFDDGPSARYTPPILAALAAQCTKATFFSVGEMAAESPAILKEVVGQGHTISGHTWSHKNLPRQSYDRAKQEIDSGFAAVEKAVGTPIAPFFRFPYLSESATTVAYLKSRNIAMFAVDVDSLDWRTHSPRKVIQRVMNGLNHRGRGIILFHDIHGSTAAALPQLLSMIKAKGFKVVHLSSKAPVHALSE